MNPPGGVSVRLISVGCQRYYGTSLCEVSTQILLNITCVCTSLFHGLFIRSKPTTKRTKDKSLQNIDDNTTELGMCVRLIEGILLARQL